MRNAPLLVLATLLWFCSLGPSSTALSAEPYLSVRTGLRCSVCHTNMTGGGKRNAFGSIYAQTRLSMMVTSLGDGGSFMATDIADILSIGADLRARASRKETEDETLYPFEIEEGNLYIEATLIRDRLTFYVDEEFAPGNPRSREVFALIKGLPGESYLKVGKFFLPYGFRLLDDTEFIRQRTGFNFDNSDLGVEFGLEPGPLSVAVAVTNGTQGAAENNNDKQFSGYAAVVFPRWRVGVSGSRNEGETGDREAFGAFGGFRLGRFAFLGEYDFINDDPPDGRRGDQAAAFIEGDVLVTQGLNLKIAYGFLDPDRDIGENSRYRVRVGAESFITQFLQASVYYSRLEDIPQVGNRDEVTFGLHTFF